MSFPGRIRSEQISYVLSCLSGKSKDDLPNHPSENLNTSAYHSCISSTLSVRQTVKRKDCAHSPIKNRAGYPSIRRTGPGQRRTSCPASLTVEAALELPLLILCIIVALHFSIVCRASAEFSGKMAEAAEQMALVAYTKAYNDSNHVIRGALSDTWAYSQVIPKAKDKDAVKNASFLFSSYLSEEEKISLVLTYQVRSPAAVVPLPGTVFIQKMTIRGWTGKEGSSSEDGSDQGKNGKSGTKVYVTDHGTVYHTDPNCSHLKLDIHKISASDLKSARNISGARYKKCKYCGKLLKEGDFVYISPYGDAYHASASCPGLTRTLNTVDIEDVKGMRECHDCENRRKA